MKIAIIKPTPSVITTNGIKLQAINWGNGLKNLGHHITLIDFWENYDLTSFDIILIIDCGLYINDIVKVIKKTNPNIVLAPIIDTNLSPTILYYASKYFKLDFLKFRNNYHELYKARKDIKLFLARTEYEKRIIQKWLNISNSRILIIPLHSRFTELYSIQTHKKEKFCFHVSLLYQKRKNVERLIKAAVKYKFYLKLAGPLFNNEEKEWLYNLISKHFNIEYIGYLSDEELCQYYKRAKVFALPSIYEGVGMAALEAASYGSDIVITKIGGPKEYYNNMAYQVNPYDVDDIGRNILKAFDHSHQPALQKYIFENYNLDKCMKKLENALEKVLNT